MSKADWRFWLLAGEALSKCEHLAGVALSPKAAEELSRIYLVKGALATTAIEGNTLTEEEVRQRVEGVLQLPPSKEYLGVEIDNIVRAFDGILSDCLKGTARALTPEVITGFNAEVLRGLKLPEHVEPGRLRTYSVGVADYRGAPAEDLPDLLEQLCRWLAESWIGPIEGYAQADALRLEAIFKAVVAHLYLAWIHPFGDGNGRTARLVEFFILAGAGIPFPAAHLLSNHYNETRTEYYRQLSMASKSGGEVLPFLNYALRGLVDQLREQSALIKQEQLELFWRDHLHQVLGDSEAGKRKRYLVTDLGNSPEPVSKSKLTEISVRVLRHYLGKSEKTLARDMDELARLGLVIKTGDRYRANKEIVLAYLPPKKQLAQ
jgi:Fic family protein